MLVLSRKVGESFVIGDDITVTVVRITGGAVRLGIEAPPECDIVRKELIHALGGFVRGNPPDEGGSPKRQ
ncbi:MAG: carbon storage regulator CsrA [Pirellulaceae bacterium]